MPQSNSPFAVLWDMDGVLIDTGPYHLKTWADALAPLGITYDEAMFRKTFGMNNHGVLSVVFGREPEPELVHKLAGEKEAAFREMIRGQAQPLPGVREWLARLKAAGVRQALASSAPQANIDVLVEALNIREYFDALVSAEAMPGKPNPAVFLEAARRLGLPPERCVVVEDAVPGVRAAKAAGMRCLAVTNTNPREALSEADRVVDSLEELEAGAFEAMMQDGGRW